ncbi:hypothetical protein NK662_14525 [Ectobacillus sp. SYSU M60031]|uniref:Uncharacterized protein n=1 Tax=Ectobacillus ponti TaxID=2961894 RepID=A0AA41XBC1_9BACI|nr:hypothetical protein [Ectobacillus ponti]
MANQVYQMSYDDEIDKDIHEWLEGLKRSRKAEMVRHAIRFYITAVGQNKYVHTMPAVQAAAPQAAILPQQGTPQPEPVAAQPVEEPKPDAVPGHKKKPALPRDGRF